MINPSTIQVQLIVMEMNLLKEMNKFKNIVATVQTSSSKAEINNQSAEKISSRSKGNSKLDLPKRELIDEFMKNVMVFWEIS